MEGARALPQKIEKMAKIERKHRPETLVQQALRSVSWHDDPILSEWRRAHRQYRQALEVREARKRLLRRSVMNRGVRWGRREQVRRGLPAWNRSADRYLPGDRFVPQTIPACDCQTVPTCNRPPRKHRPNKAEKAQRRREAEWAVLQQREHEAYWAALRRDLGLDGEAPAPDNNKDAHSQVKWRLEDNTIRETLAEGGTIGGLEVVRRKFYWEDEFGIGYIIDENGR